MGVAVKAASWALSSDLDRNRGQVQPISTNQEARKQMSDVKSVSAKTRLAFLYRIGSCPKCMRESFLAMVMAWTVCALSLIFGSFFNFGILSIASLALAGGLTALWLTHLLTYSVRTAGMPNQSMPGTAPLQSTTRRSVLGRFGRALAAVALSTALPTFALADNPCPGQLTCGFTQCSSNGTTCCPNGYPWLNACNCQCYQTLQGVRNAGCRGQDTCSELF